MTLTLQRNFPAAVNYCLLSSKSFEVKNDFKFDVRNSDIKAVRSCLSSG